jgi:catechol 2,3-dioxygenase-like lactoylglutathione lyase family enzyme
MNESVTVTNALPMYSGSFDITPPLGIDRGNYIALHSSDPAAAAKFAADHMGFYLLHVDREGRHYLAAHGLDPYSLVYSQGEHGRVDHISYVLTRAEDLSVAERLLTERGIKSTRMEKSSMWRHGPALHFKNPGGQTIELTPGVNVPVPMASWAAAPQNAPGPITFDHAVVRAVDVAAGLEFASKILGLRESSRIVAPDGIPVLSFYRAHTLYHCYAVARSQYDGLHHLQFTLKDPPAVYAAAEKLKANGKIEVIWGPLRHGAGHNIAFYFRDYTGNIVEFSAEEEIILNSTTYQPRSWSVTDPLAADEWTLSPIPDAMH